MQYRRLGKGSRSSRFGKAKVIIPSPPNVVPSRLKSALFWAMLRSWPREGIHPFGTNLSGNSVIWPSIASIYARHATRGSTAVRVALTLAARGESRIRAASQSAEEVQEVLDRTPDRALRGCNTAR